LINLLVFEFDDNNFIVVYSVVVVVIVIIVVVVVLMNDTHTAGSAVLQGAVCGLAGLFPEKYMQAVMGGMVSHTLFNQSETSTLSNQSVTYFVQPITAILGSTNHSLTLFNQLDTYFAQPIRHLLSSTNQRLTWFN